MRGMEIMAMVTNVTCAGTIPTVGFRLKFRWRETIT
jgi:hypothetical protein